MRRATRSTIAVALAAVTLLLVSCGGKSASTSSPAPSRAGSVTATAAAPSPTVSPSPSIVSALPGTRMVTKVADVPFPPDTNLFILDGPWGKDGGPFDLRRVYRIGNGPLQQDTLYKPPSGSYLSSVFAVPDASVLYISVCSGSSDCEALGQVTKVSTAFYRSIDGGITWQSVGSPRPARWSVQAMNGRHAIAVSWDFKQVEYLDVDADELLHVPPSLSALSMFAAGDQPAWWDRNILLVRGISGNSLLKPASVDPTHLYGLGLLLGGPGGEGALSVLARPDDPAGPRPSPGGYVLVYPRAVDVEPTVLGFQDGPPTVLGGWLDASHIAVTMDYQRPGSCATQGITAGADPAILDTKAATIAFIHEPFYDPNCSRGTQRVIAAQTGKLAQVNGGWRLRQPARSTVARIGVSSLPS